MIQTRDTSKSVYIVGDSHGSGYYNHYITKKLFNHNYDDLEYPVPDPRNDVSFAYDEDIIVKYTRTFASTAYSLNYEQEINIKESHKDVIISCLGEVDIRVHLVKNNNAESTAEDYFYRTLNRFLNNKLLFLLPIPVPESFERRDFGTIDQRVEQRKLFVNKIGQLCGANNLLEPVDPAKILGVESIGGDQMNDPHHINADLAYLIMSEILDTKRL